MTPVNRPDHSAAGSDETARRVAALRWQLDNNRAAYDRQAQLPMQMEFLRDLLLGLRRTRVWQVIRILRRLKRAITGRSGPDPLEAALARLSAPSRLELNPDVRALLHPERDYLRWIATSEAGVLARLAGPGDEVPVLAVEAGLASGLAGVRAPFVALLSPGWRLAQAAPAVIGASLAANPAVDLLYTDVDAIGRDGVRAQPDFRPDWDPEQHLGRDLLAGLLVVRTGMLRAPGVLDDLPEQARLFALSLRLVAASRAERIRHVPAVLCHRVSVADDRAVRRDVAAGFLGLEVTVVPQGLRVHRRLPVPAPRASLIIPTKDRPDLLGPCLEGLLRGTDYPDLEVVVIDNGTTDAAAQALLARASEDLRVRVIRDEGPFNWSRLNNVGAAAASGDVLVLLNNDTAMPDPQWLTELVSQAMRPEIGAVGPMLLYPDGRIQQAGLAVDDHGNARHLFRFRDGGDGGPSGMLGVARLVTGVTGACLAVRREVYVAAGGPTEALAVACNDVDFCLRLQALGFANLWTPFAVVEHRELASRGADASPERHARAVREVLQLRRDWGGALLRDPAINANLVIVDEELWLRGATPNE